MGSDLWISQKLVSDKGGEFSNAEIRNLGEVFSIKLINTAAESPWSNGTVEKTEWGSWQVGFKKYWVMSIVTQNLL